MCGAGLPESPELVPPLGRHCGQLCSVIDRKLPIDAVQMHLNGAFRHIELVRSLLVRQSLDYQKHNFALAGGKPIQRMRGVCMCLLRLFGRKLHHCGRQNNPPEWAQKGPAVCDPS